MERCNTGSNGAGAGSPQWMNHEHQEATMRHNGSEVTGMTSEPQRRPTEEGGVVSGSDASSSREKGEAMMMYDQQQQSGYSFNNHHQSSSYSMMYNTNGGYGMYHHHQQQQQQSFHPSMMNSSYQQQYHGEAGGLRHSGITEYHGSNGTWQGGGEGVFGPSPTNQVSSSTEAQTSSNRSSSRPSPSAGEGAIAHGRGNPSSFPALPHHADYHHQYHPQFSMNSTSCYSDGAGKHISNTGAQVSSSFQGSFHDHSGESSHFYYNYNQGSTMSIPPRPGSQQSVDMPGGSGYSSRPDSTASFSNPMMNSSGYYQHPSIASQGYHHHHQFHPSMSSSYHHYHQGHMAAYPQPQYSNQHLGQYHHSMMPHSGNTTPSSQMAGISFDDARSKSQQQQHHHHHQNHHAAPLSASFSSELDDSSRTSSPSGIPAPPHKIHRGGVPMSAPAKIRIPVATRPQDRAESLGPLRESSQRLNVLQESTSMDSVEESAARNDQGQSTGGIKPPTSGDEPRSCPAEKRLGMATDVCHNTKPTTSIHDASLLLGLRTSCSGSPATLPTVTDETFITHEHSDDEDVTLGGSDGARPLTDETEDFVPYIPKDYPTRLARPQDRSMLNSLHCYIRSNLLEVFVIEKTKVTTPNLSPSTSLGRVGLRCVYCAELRKRNGAASNTEAPMAVFYPKAVKDIYRMVTSWQRCHLRKCRNLPPAVRSEWDELREHDKSRGKTVFWLTSAREIGLVDCPSRAGGVRFARPSSALLTPAEESTHTQAGATDFSAAATV